VLAVAVFTQKPVRPAKAKTKKIQFATSLSCDILNLWLVLVATTISHHEISV
jgi:hypothetical protein